jgi:hypothetical protein
MFKEKIGLTRPRNAAQQGDSLKEPHETKIHGEKKPQRGDVRDVHGEKLPAKDDTQAPR